MRPAGRWAVGRMPKLATLGIVLQSVGLPLDFRAARVAFWLADEDILDALRNRLGAGFDSAIRNFVLSTAFHHAVMAEKPSLAASARDLSDRLRDTFPQPPETQALNDLENLQKLLGRFQVPINLGEADMDAVIRKTVLRKSSQVADLVRAKLDACAGEISRQLQGTQVAHRDEDNGDAVLDWPLAAPSGTRRRCPFDIRTADARKRPSHRLRDPMAPVPRKRPPGQCRLERCRACWCECQAVPEAPARITKWNASDPFPPCAVGLRADRVFVLRAELLPVGVGVQLRLGIFEGGGVSFVSSIQSTAKFGRRVLARAPARWSGSAFACNCAAHLEGRRADRNRLRALGRSLGDRLLKGGAHEVQRLTEAAAYVQWHRLLFGRFLLECGLLCDEAGVPI